MALEAQQRKVLRSLQLCLKSSLPAALLEDVGRNDPDAWSALSMREVRMLIARGQTYHARQFGGRVIAAAAAGLPVEAFNAREYSLLIASIDSVLASWHHLALRQLKQLLR